MKHGTDAVARDARVVRLDRAFRWPGGRHVAVVLNVAYEGWSDGKAPGIGPMGNPLPAGAFDTNAPRGAATVRRAGSSGCCARWSGPGGAQA